MAEAAEAGSLPSGRALRERTFWQAIGIGMLSMPLILCFLAPAARIEGEALGMFLLGVALIFVPLTGLSRLVYRRWLRPAERYLNELEAGDPDPALCADAFSAVMDFPRRLFLYGLGIWSGGSSALGIWMWLQVDTWNGSAVLLLAVSGLCGGFVAQVFGFVWFRRQLEPLRDHLAQRIPSAETRRRLIRRVPLAAKLLIAISGMIFVTQIFGVCLSLIRARRGAEDVAASQQGRALELVARELGAGAGPDEAVATAADQAALFGIQLGLVDARSGEVLVGRKLPLVEREIDWLLREESQRGDSRSLGSDNSFSWAALPDTDGVVVAAISGEELAQLARPLGIGVAINVIVFTLMAVAISLIVARDQARATRSLARALERIAAGDLTDRSVYESDDEHGDLGRALGETVTFLRSTLSRVSETADRVEATSAGVSTASQTVADATAAQVRATRMLSESMLQINEQIDGVTASSAALDAPTEESASAAAALGAASGRLTENASSLSAKVTEVYRSIVSMTESMGTVNEKSHSMALSTTEAASTVEEMAATANEVQTNAVETARLSIEVVEAADKGRDRVGQTIEGMTAIREATEAAEQVIRSLGERTAEISGFLQLIDDVADETNLLALNAAIIAAQAGERGRAFAVVAAQIKALAVRVLTNTKDISGQIRAIQDESRNAIAAVETGARSVARGVELSAEAGVSLEGITEAARESGDRVAQIVSAVSQQTSAAAQVAELMARLRTEVDEIADSCRTQEQGSRVVHDGSDAMQEMARDVHGTAERQSQDTRQISVGIDSVRKAVADIHVALDEQGKACRRVATLLEEAHERTQVNEETARELEDSGRSLQESSDALRADIDRFRT